MKKALLPGMAPKAKVVGGKGNKSRGSADYASTFAAQSIARGTTRVPRGGSAVAASAASGTETGGASKRPRATPSMVAPRWSSKSLTPRTVSGQLRQDDSGLETSEDLCDWCSAPATKKSNPLDEDGAFDQCDAHQSFHAQCPGEVTWKQQAAFYHQSADCMKVGMDKAVQEHLEGKPNLPPESVIAMQGDHSVWLCTASILC